jgi:hypothetical protein
MEACPPKLIEGVVGRLIPPARREDVLGDLRERYSSPGAYLNQALHVVPLVLFSQLRRTSDGLLMAWEAFILFLVLRGSPWSTWVQLTQLTLPIAAVVAALALRDAYTPPPVSAHPPDPEAAFDAALKRSVAAALMAVAACLPQAVLYVLDVGPSWLLPRPVLVRAVLGGFLMLVPLRVAWETQFRYGGYRRITQHGIRRETMTADAYRHALERRRDTLRRSWLWYLAFLVPVQVLFALPRSLVYARLWSTVFEATMTFVAVLLLWKLARRMADALQHEIDSLESP